MKKRYKAVFRGINGKGDRFVEQIEFEAKSFEEAKKKYPLASKIFDMEEVEALRTLNTMWI